MGEYQTDKKQLSSDDLLESILDGSRRNKFILGILFIGPIFGPLQIFSLPFFGLTPDYWCRIEHLSAFSIEERKNLSTPLKNQSIEEGSSCQTYDFDFSPLKNLSFDDARNLLDQMIEKNDAEIDCSHREFDPSLRTAATQWDLVCNRKVLFSTVQAATYIGSLIGSFVAGLLIDRFGRLFIYRIHVLCYLILGFLTCLCPSIESFIFLKMMTSIFQMGIYMANYIMAMEFCTVKLRPFIGNCMAVSWAFGIVLTAGLAFCVRDWQQLQAVTVFPYLLIIPTFWVLLESPRWLLVKERLNEGYKVLEELNSSNRDNLEKDFCMEQLSIWKNSTRPSPTTSTQKSLKKGIMDNIALWLSPFTRSKNICKQTLCVFFCWFTASMIYYGVSLGASTVNANEYLYMLIGGILEIPSYLILWPSTVYFGRRKSLIIFYVISGISIISVMILFLLGKENSGANFVLYLIGKLAITAAFQLLWFYTAELYPTEIRSLVIGESSTFARIGSMCSPYINDLLIEKASYAPSALFGVFSFLAGLVCLTFPETKTTVL